MKSPFHQNILVHVGGGLANQTFEYIFLRWLEIKTGEECLVDDSAFFRAEVSHNGYELDYVFGIQLPMLSQYVPKDKWMGVKQKYDQDGTLSCQALFDAGYDFTVVAADAYAGYLNYNGTIVYVRNYDENLVFAKGFLYMYGDWITYKYLRDIKSEIIRELTFPPLKGERNIKLSQLMRDTKSVAVHIRRNTFIDEKRDIPADVYSAAIEKLSRLDNHLTWFVFSDDLPWCKNNVKELGFQHKDVVFVDGNVKRDSYIDMQLMTLCKHRILCSSSFSYLASLLRHDTDGIVLKLVDAYD